MDDRSGVSVSAVAESIRAAMFSLSDIVRDDGGEWR